MKMTDRLSSVCVCVSCVITFTVKYLQTIVHILKTKQTHFATDSAGQSPTLCALQIHLLTFTYLHYLHQQD